MYLFILGVIAVGTGILLVYYSVRDKKTKKINPDNWSAEEKGKVIYLFDDNKEDAEADDSKSEEPVEPEPPENPQ